MRARLRSLTFASAPTYRSQRTTPEHHHGSVTCRCGYRPLSTLAGSFRSAVILERSPIRGQKNVICRLQEPTNKKGEWPKPPALFAFGGGESRRCSAPAESLERFVAENAEMSVQRMFAFEERKDR